MKPVITDMLRCRDVGHDWEETIAGRRQGWGKRRDLYCGICGTSRTELVDINGDVGSRHYDYNPDYKQVSKFSKQEARQQRMYKRRSNGNV